MVLLSVTRGGGLFLLSLPFSLLLLFFFIPFFFFLLSLFYPSLILSLLRPESSRTIIFTVSLSLLSPPLPLSHSASSLVRNESLPWSSSDSLHGHVFFGLFFTFQLSYCFPHRLACTWSPLLPLFLLQCCSRISDLRWHAPTPQRVGMLFLILSWRSCTHQMTCTWSLFLSSFFFSSFLQRVTDFWLGAAFPLTSFDLVRCLVPSLHFPAVAGPFRHQGT
jgi:hypothetical protein